MKKGEIIKVDGKRFKIQKVIPDSVYASLMISDDKCQRGKPRRFKLDELAKLTGVTVEALKSDTLNGSTLMKEQLKESIDTADSTDSDSDDLETSESEATEQTSDEPLVASGQKSPLHDVLNQYESDESSDIASDIE